MKSDDIRGKQKKKENCMEDQIDMFHSKNSMIKITLLSHKEWNPNVTSMLIQDAYVCE